MKIQLETGQTVEEFYCEESRRHYADDWVSTYLILEVDMIKKVVTVLCLGEAQTEHSYNPGDIVGFPLCVFTEPPDTYWTSDGKYI